MTDKNLREQVHYNPRPQKGHSQGLRHEGTKRDHGAKIEKIRNQVRAYTTGEITRRTKVKLLATPGTAVLQLVAACDIRDQIWTALRSPWTLSYTPRANMPVGMYGMTKTMLEKMHADV